MNERSSYFCTIASRTAMRFVGGDGSVDAGSCQAPAFGGIDWIFGSKYARALAWNEDTSTLGRISDHPLITAEVQGPGVRTRIS